MTSAAATSEHGAEGSVIANKYRLDQLLAEGGMGSIWRAFNLQLESPVAVKLLRADLEGPELGERLRVEARAAARLAHPSIVRVFDVGEAEWGDPFIVMELLEGESFASVVAQGALAAADAVRLLLPIAEGLTLAHSRGIIHRDLKPENIFLANVGGAVQPKLLDFGIAKVSAGVTGARALTQTGTLLGSPDYMSPEQAYARSDVDERTDVWSFCVVLYEALAGRMPFAGENCAALLRSVVGSEPVPLQAFGIEPALAALVARGLMKDRERRPASMLELGRALADWLVSQGISQDVTGASLDAKWLVHAGIPSPPSAPLSPAVMSGTEATLRSVTRPSLRSSDEIELGGRPQRRRRIVSVSVVVVATALAGGAAFASWDRSTTRSRVAGAPLSAPSDDTETLRPQPQVQAPPLVPVEALPALPIASTVAAPAVRKPLPKAAQQVAFRVASTPTASPKAAASTLPRALPARSGKADLLNPY